MASYPLPLQYESLLQLGMIPPLLTYLLFLLLIPYLQCRPPIAKFRAWLFLQLKTSRKETWTGYGQYTLALFLDALAGYGYRPGRTLVWYFTVILSFATVYVVLGTITGHVLNWNEALVFSITSFHGRGFFPGQSGGDPLLNPLLAFSAGEAVVGLVIRLKRVRNSLYKELFGATLGSRTLMATKREGRICFAR